MKNKNKWYSTQIGLLIIIFLLTSCQQVSENVNRSPSATSTSPKKPAPTPRPTQVPYNLSIQVNAEDGPFAGAVVQVSEIPGSKGKKETSGEGIISWKDIPSDNISLSISAQGYITTEITAKMERGDNQITINIDRDPYGMLPSRACAPGESLVYLEDLQDGHATNWEEVEFKVRGWQVVPHPKAPNDMVISKISNFESYTNLSNLDFNDAVFRVKFMPVGKPVYNFGWQRKNGGYQVDGTSVEWSAYTMWFHAPHSTHVYRIQPPISWDEIRYAGWTPDSGKWHLLEISSFDDKIEIWLDSVSLFEYVDQNPMPSGYINMGVGLQQTPENQSIVYFDDISVCKLTSSFEPMPPVTDFGPVIFVPVDIATIQEAIEIAKNGDEIIVLPGTYIENIDFNGKNITVRSTEPANEDVVSRTIIKGKGNGSVVVFENQENSDAKLLGFTITGGNSTNISAFGTEIFAGGGILINQDSSPTIENNLLIDNISQFGGGIGIFGESSPIIKNNQIISNDGSIGGGGIAIAQESSPIIIGNLITENNGTFGGGIDILDNSSPTISNNDILQNNGRYGGGISIDTESTVFIEDNDITGNIAYLSGGGIIIADNSVLILRGNTFDGNTATEEYGGGLYAMTDSVVALSNNTFSNNTAWSGGGVRADQGAIFKFPEPDKNEFINNQPDDIYGYSPESSNVAEVDLDDYEYLPTLSVPGDEEAMNQLIANLLALPAIETCPEIHVVKIDDAEVPTFGVAMTVNFEDSFWVIINSLEDASDPFGVATFGAITDKTMPIQNVLVSAIYTPTEGLAKPGEYRIQVAFPGCEVYSSVEKWP